MRLDYTRRMLLAATMTGALAACARGTAPAAGPVAIGYQKGGLLLLARARGTIDHALAAIGRPAAQWVEFPSGPPMLEAIASGAIDLGAVGESPPIFAQAAGSPVVYLAAERVSGRNSAILVPRHSAINRAADLRGKRVGFTRASSAHLVLAKALRGAGLGFADIVPVNLSPADAAGAFAGGSIDAWSIWDPFYALEVARSQARAIVTGDQLLPSDAFFVGSRAATQAKPGDLRAILAALRETGAWARQHEDEVVALTARLTGLAPEIARLATDRRGQYDVVPVTADVVGRQQANADIFADLKLIPGRVVVADAVWAG